LAIRDLAQRSLRFALLGLTLRAKQHSRPASLKYWSQAIAIARPAAGRP
jgi:hypothetical protein